ncbi:MAG: hypothetical protein N2053_07095 [Chitinispirillaceae bacterium]|nr:hypothetical protein [Chitinispirillaceae bacterium]
MNKIIMILSLVLLCTVGLSAQLDSFLVKGHMRSYLVHSPTGISNAPLVLCLHGAKGDPVFQQNTTQFDTIADREKFIVVYPSGRYANSNRNWDYSGDEDVEFLRALIDTMYKRFQIDKSRVYCCGFSLGGMMTYRMACSSADKIAAIVSVSGPFRGGECVLARPIPVMHIHGLADNTISYSNAVSSIETWKSLEGCPTQAETIDPYLASNPSSKVKYERWAPCNENSEIILLSVTGCDHSWPTMENVGFNASEEIWRFFKRHSLNGTNTTIKKRDETKKGLRFSGISGLRIPADARQIRVFNLQGAIVDECQYPRVDMQKSTFLTGYLTRFAGIFVIEIMKADGTTLVQSFASGKW